MVVFRLIQLQSGHPLPPTPTDLSPPRVNCVEGWPGCGKEKRSDTLHWIGHLIYTLGIPEMPVTIPPVCSDLLVFRVPSFFHDLTLEVTGGVAQPQEQPLAGRRLPSGSDFHHSDVPGASVLNRMPAVLFFPFTSISLIFSLVYFIPKSESLNCVIL